MEYDNSKNKVWIDRFLSGLAIVFLLFDGITKFFVEQLQVM